MFLYYICRYKHFTSQKQFIMYEENINWDFVCRSILNQKCIVFIGHGLTVNYSAEKSLDKTFRHLAEQNKGSVLSFHQKDGFLVFRDENSKLLNLNKIIEFYKNDFSNPLLEKLSEIPFHFIINTSPDDALKRIFERRNFACQYNYYSIQKLRDIQLKPDKETPLVYNIFGSIEEDQSLIVSHYDLFRYIKSVYAYNNLPQVVKASFNSDSANNIIFLGFDFDRWYFQLLLNLLNLNFDPCIRYAAESQQIDIEMKTLYESQFKIQFVNQDVEWFINNLHAQFTKDQLRKPKEQTLAPKKFNKGKVLKFLNEAFNATDLESICLCYFEEVHSQFTPEQSKITRINALIDYVSRQNRFDELLEIGKEQNHVQYQKFAPYEE